MIPLAHEADVIIVGAGLSGMIAAREVLKAGLEPLILEADTRVGGRILTEQVAPGISIEVGAQWIGDTFDKMFALAADLGVETFPQFEEGETTYEICGPVMRESEFHERNAKDLEGVQQTLDKIDEMSSTIDLQAPWLSPHANEWDRITGGAWYDSLGLAPVARTMMEICTVGILGVPTHEASLLDMLYNVQVCGVTSEIFAESEGGAQTTRFVGGTSEIPNRLAATLGDRIILDAFVQTIEYTNDSVKVICRNGVVATGKQVIVAIAPTLAGRITYDPPLPGIRDQMTQRIAQASAVKVFAIYDEPFWREEGLNGQLISDIGPARMSNDSCMPEGADGPGIILGFLEGEEARTFGRLSEDELHAKVAEEFGRHFGPRAAKPEMVVSGEWANRPFTRGCYNANFGPFGWTHFGSALSAPIGPIKWGATETATAWSGYMEGAVDSGERAAKEVIEAISG